MKKLYKTFVFTKKITLNTIGKYSQIPSQIIWNQKIKKSRNKKEIVREFGKEKYSLILEKLKESNGRELDKVFFEDSAQGVYTYKKRFMVKPKHKIRFKYKLLINRTLAKYTRGCTQIIELGAGSGEILYFLSKRKFKNRQLLGCEITKEGLECIDILGSYSNNKIRSAYLNLFTKTIDKKNLTDNGAIFTSQVLMYLKKIDSNLINFIISLNPSIIIFIEPTTEYLPDSIYKDLAAKYMLTNAYHNNTMSSIISNFEKLKDWEIVSLRKNIYSLNPFLPLSILVYRRVSK